MTTRTREELVNTYKRLSLGLADEALPEIDAEAIRRQLSAVRDELEVLDHQRREG